MVARVIKPKKIPRIEQPDPQLEAWRQGWNACWDAFNKQAFTRAQREREE